MLIMHIFFLQLHENYGCYSNKNSQNVAKTYGYLDNSNTIQISLIKLGM